MGWGVGYIGGGCDTESTKDCTTQVEVFAAFSRRNSNDVQQKSLS